MRSAVRDGLGRLIFPLGVVLAAALAVSTSGCLALFGGVQDTTVDVQVVQRTDGSSSFWAWNEITIDQDISSVNSATLLSVTLSVETPVGTPDLTFLSTLKGEAVTPTGRTTVVTLERFPKGEQAVIMTVLFQGDLQALFKDQHTFRIEWTGSMNPAFTAWPADGTGFGVKADIQIDVQ